MLNCLVGGIYQCINQSNSPFTLTCRHPSCSWYEIFTDWRGMFGGVAEYSVRCAYMGSLIPQFDRNLTKRGGSPWLCHPLGISRDYFAATECMQRSWIMVGISAGGCFLIFSGPFAQLRYLVIHDFPSFVDAQAARMSMEEIGGLPDNHRGAHVNALLQPCHWITHRRP